MAFVRCHRARNDRLAAEPGTGTIASREARAQIRLKHEWHTIYDQR